MTKLLTYVLSVAIQSTITYYYFKCFGLTWQSVIPFFLAVQLIKEALQEVVTKNKN